ncbi:hypothetical protein BKA93DRAFT_762728 [Sparassis latifolia]
MFAKSLDLGWFWWKLGVRSEDQAPVALPKGRKKRPGIKRPRAVPQRKSNESEDEAGMRYFLVGKPHFEQQPNLPGCSTRGYVALDCKTKKFVFLKDTWRLDQPEHKTEGAVLEVLKKAKVTNVPTLVCHGDIARHHTRTRDFFKPKDKPRVDPFEDPPSKYVHYRLVANEVCCPLEDFEEGKELLQIIVDCMDAHRQAVEKAALMHCNISNGNTLIYERYVRRGGEYERLRTGLLCDWEHATSVRAAENGDKEAPRKLGARATWPFMSVLSLDHPKTAITIQDELEGFFYVLLLTTAWRIDNNIRTTDFIPQFFDSKELLSELSPSIYSCGPSKRQAMHAGVLKHNDDELRFFDAARRPHPFEKVFRLFMHMFRAHYTTLVYEKDSEEVEPEDAQEQIPLQVPRQGAESRVRVERVQLSEEDLNARKHLAESLKTHQAMRQLLLMFLDREWPCGDKIEPKSNDSVDSDSDSWEEPMGPASPEVELDLPRLKRGRDEDEDDEEDEERRPRKVQRANSEEV